MVSTALYGFENGFEMSREFSKPLGRILLVYWTAWGLLNLNKWAWWTSIIFLSLLGVLGVIGVVMLGIAGSLELAILSS